jgi:hypothetical protein
MTSILLTHSFSGLDTNTFVMQSNKTTLSHAKDNITSYIHNPFHRIIPKAKTQWPKLGYRV